MAALIRLENLELEHRNEAQVELLELAAALEKLGAKVEVAGLDESMLAKLEESAGGVAVDVLNVILDPAKEIAVGVVSAAIYDWAKRRRRFRGDRPDDRPQARLYIVEDGHIYDYAIDLDPQGDET